MRLALIAMSGVRVRDTELEALGLTLPGFVDRGKVIASLPSLGLLTLAGMADSRFDVSYHEVDQLEPDSVPIEDVEVVAISSFSARIQSAYRLADRYRQRGVRVLLGGLHVTACPDEALQHADAIVLGEAEPVFPRLLEGLVSDRLRPVYRAAGPAFDLAASPMPRFDLLADRAFDRYTIQTQRGCPWNCEFCAASIRLRPGYRTKPGDRIQAEVEQVMDLGGRPFLELADDNTFANAQHGRDVCDALAPFGLRWFTETDLSFADDPDLISRAADSGCVQVLIGFESPSPAGLAGVELRSDWKARQADRARSAIEAIQSRGIAVNGCFVLGLDGRGPEQFDDVVDFVEDSGLQEAQVTVQTPFPGTPLYDRFATEGRLLEPEDWDRCTLFDVNFEPDGVTAEALRQGLHDVIAKLYTEDRVRARRARFRAQRRAP